MARDRTPTISTSSPMPTALVASAVRLSSGVTDYLKHSRSARTWQLEAWKFYDTIGEFRYACDWVGSMLSKAILHAAVEDPDGPKIVDSGLPAQYMAMLFGGPEGQTEMLRQMGIHFTVAGECYLFAWETEVGAKWMIGASTSVSVRKGKDLDQQETLTWFVNGERVGPEDVETDVLAIRMWKPHPQRPNEANSPARAVLSILAEIGMLSDHVFAQGLSRLAGAGILMMPSEMTLPPAPPGGSSDPTMSTPSNTASAFMALLQEAMATAIQNRSDASAVTPIVITAPGDQIGNARYLTFWTEFDQHAVELRTEAIGRLALGLDMPPEILTGVSGGNHWNAWLADESAIKAHTEPLLRVITSALTQGYLRPALLPTDTDLTEVTSLDVNRIIVRADTSQMRLRPNRSKEAIELYDRAELSGAALRRENGFSVDDALDQGGTREWFIRKVAAGQTTPEIVAEALRLIGLDFTAVAEPTREHEERPTRSLLEHPERNPPEMESGLIEAANQIVVRALERAGNRIRNRTQVKIPGVTALNTYLYVDVRPPDMDFLLSDAWVHVPDVANRHGLSPDWLTASLNAYCRLAMQDKRKHDYAMFHDYLTGVAVLKGVRAA